MTCGVDLHLPERALPDCLRTAITVYHSALQSGNRDTKTQEISPSPTVPMFSIIVAGLTDGNDPTNQRLKNTSSLHEGMHTLRFNSWRKTETRNHAQAAHMCRHKTVEKLSARRRDDEAAMATSIPPQYYCQPLQTLSSGGGQINHIYCILSQIPRTNKHSEDTAQQTTKQAHNHGHNKVHRERPPRIRVHTTKHQLKKGRPRPRYLLCTRQRRW